MLCVSIIFNYNYTTHQHTRMYNQQRKEKLYQRTKIYNLRTHRVKHTKLKKYVFNSSDWRIYKFSFHRITVNIHFYFINLYLSV